MGRRIMVVDDEEDLLAITEMFLHECGWQNIDSFSDPFKALEHFTQKNNGGNYVLVLPDVRMPGLNGFELAAKILELNSQVKILLMSAFDVDKKMQDNLLVLNSKDILRKPFSLEYFCNAIKNKIG